MNKIIAYLRVVRQMTLQSLIKYMIISTPILNDLDNKHNNYIIKSKFIIR